MKTKNLIFAVVSLVFLQCGCEVDRADRSISITPSSADVSYGQSIQLSASGGYFYTWSMENNAWGRFNNIHGDSVIYTSIYNPSNEASSLQTITVVSRYTDSSNTSNTSTSQTDYVDSGEAYIRHVP